MEDYNLYAILDENNIVINLTTFSENYKPFTIDGKVPTLNELLDPYPNCTLQEYDDNGVVTNNSAIINYYYDNNLNAFIPPQPDPTYILNTQTFEWEPDQNLTYDLHGDGIMYKWIRIGWVLTD